MSSVQNAKKRVVSAMAGEKVVSLHKVRSSWILQLDNAALLSLIESSAAHIHPTNAQIEKINRACIAPVSNKEYKNHLRSAGIFLTSGQVRWVNTANRQIQYYNLIENDALRAVAKAFHIYRNFWNPSIKKQIFRLNQLLHRTVIPETLSVALAKLHITASHKQLEAIISEAVERIQASPCLSARNDYEVLKSTLNSLNIRAIRRQFSGYLTLIINESALSSEGILSLKSEIFSVIPPEGAEPIENPYRAVVRSIRQQGERLHQRRSDLLQERQTVERDHLLVKINKVLALLETSTYRDLMQQEFALEKWGNTKVVGDRLHREIILLAPERVLHSGQASRLLNKLYYRSLTEVLEPNLMRLCRDATYLNALLIDYTKQVNALDASDFDPVPFYKSIEAAKTQHDLEVIDAQTNEFSELLAFLEKKQQLKTVFSSVSSQFINFSNLHKARYGSEKKILPKYRKQLDVINPINVFSVSENDFSALESSLSISLDCLDNLYLFASLKDDIRAKRALLPELKVSLEKKTVPTIIVEPISSPIVWDAPDVVSSEHYLQGSGAIWDYARNNLAKATAGTFVGGVLFVVCFPHILLSLAMIKVGGVLSAAFGIKFGVGAAAGGAATSTVGAKGGSWLRAIGF